MPVSRIDILRSLLRAGADRAAQELDRRGPMSTLRRALREIRQQQVTIEERQLTSAVAHCAEVRSASVSCRRGTIHIDATYENEALSCALEPIAARFAAQGAKELVFRVHPAEAARDSRSRQVTAAIAECVAHSAWAFSLGETPQATGTTIVDRDGTDCVRVDLRNIPAVRSLKGPSAMVVEIFAIDQLEVGNGTLTVKLRLPPLAI